MTTKRDWSGKSCTNVPVVEDELSRSDSRAGSPSLPVDIIDNTATPNFRSMVQLHDEVPDAEELATVNVITVRVKPFLKLADGTILSRQYVSTGSGVEHGADDFNARYKIDKKDTAVLGINGKVVATGTQKNMEIVAEEVSRQATIMMNKGIDLASPRTPFRSLMCKTCKLIFQQKGKLATHQRNCRREQMAFMAQQSVESEKMPNASTSNSSLSLPETETKIVSPTKMWTPSKMFTPTKLWTPTKMFTPTKMWTPTKKFTPTKMFTPAKRFTPTKMFTPAKRFTPTKKWTPTKMWTPTKIWTPNKIKTPDADTTGTNDEGDDGSDECEANQK